MNEGESATDLRLIFNLNPNIYNKLMMLYIIVTITNNTDAKTTKMSTDFPVSVSFLLVSPASITCIDVEVPPDAPWSGDTVGVFSSTLLMISVDPGNLT